MRNKDCRKEFQNLLEAASLPLNITNEQQSKTWKELLLASMNMIPNQLFRFRKYEEEYSVKSLIEGTITVCKPAVFSDKYDSLVYVDKNKGYMSEGVNKAVESFGIIDCNNATNCPQSFIDSIRFIQNPENEVAIENFKHNLYEAICLSINKQQEFIRENNMLRVACFSENIKSKCMWDRYADGYKGFALEYNFTNYIAKFWNKNITFTIFPVIYSYKRYDGTRDVLWNIVRNAASGNEFLENMLKMCPYPDQLHWYRSYLYKSKDEYEKESEWRLIYGSPNDKDSRNYIDIPDSGFVKAIYYGPDITEEHKNRLHSIAQKLGIKEYEVMIDDDTNSYEMKIIPL